MVLLAQLEEPMVPILCSVLLHLLVAEEAVQTERVFVQVQLVVLVVVVQVIVHRQVGLEQPVRVLVAETVFNLAALLLVAVAVVQVQLAELLLVF